MTTNSLLQNGTIYIGDNLPYLKSVPDQSFDLILTDPPFNTKKQQNQHNQMAYEDHWTWENVDFKSFQYLESVCPSAADFINIMGINGPFLTYFGIRSVSYTHLTLPTKA